MSGEYDIEVDGEVDAVSSPEPDKSAGKETDLQVEVIDDNTAKPTANAPEQPTREHQGAPRAPCTSLACLSCGRSPPRC